MKKELFAGVLLLVLIGWVFFFSSSPAAAFGWIGRMFGSGSALVDATAKYYLAGCWPLLLVGAIGSFPVVSHVGTNLLRRSKAWQAFSVVLFLALVPALRKANLLPAADKPE